MTAFLNHPLMLVIRQNDTETNYLCAKVCLNAGLKNIELAFDQSCSLDIIQKLKNEFTDSQIGCGSIFKLEQAIQAHKAGADFISSHHFDENLSQQINKLTQNYIPGGMTPSELNKIYQSGHKLQKLFPASRWGTKGVKGLKTTMPFLNIIATAGVDIHNAIDFLSAGASGLCFGSAFINKQDIINRNWSKIESKAKQLTKLI